MDELLLPYLKATDEQERARHEGQLLLLDAAPVVRKTLRLRLDFYIAPQGNSSCRDAEDLFQDIMAKIVQILRDLHQFSSPDIENFNRYVWVIASNACNDFLRAKSPARSRLKNNLRQVFSRHPKFCLVKIDGGIYCSFSSSPTERSPTAARQKLIDLEKNPRRFLSASVRGEEIDHPRLSRIASEALTCVGEPIEFETLVRIITGLLDINDHPIESLDDFSDAEPEFHQTGMALATDFELEVCALLKQLWLAVLKLPPKQRDVFIFGFEDERGEDFFSLLVEANVVTIPRLLYEMGRPLPELMEIWSRMPMNNKDIASELKAASRQVAKWRFNARERLAKEFRVLIKKG